MNKLPHSNTYAPGLERRIFRKLPVILLGSTIVPLLFAVGSHWLPSDLTGDDLTRHLSMVTIFTVALIITAWTAILTVAIGCVIVIVMKGPGYVVDAYRLPDSDRPKDKHEDDE